MKQKLIYGMGGTFMVFILLVIFSGKAISPKPDPAKMVDYRGHSGKSVLSSVSGSSGPGEILVRDFGAIPGDGSDDSKSILTAIEHARANDIHTIRFEAGVYNFKGLPGWESSERGKRSCYIPLQDVSGLELAGAVDKKGKPITSWVKDNDLKEGQPMILSIDGGSNITVRNISVDMAPYYYSAGRVISVKGEEVSIEVLPGHPCIDGQKAYIMGLYDLKARKAKVVRLTWDSNLPQWHTVGEERKRRMTTNYTALAKNCSVNDGVFWFQGNYTGSILNFGHISNLVLENVYILSGHGFSITCNFCHDVTYRNVKILLEGNRIATTCRDGFKIYCASGKVLMDGVHNEGCLGDDGQNIHGTWLSVLRKQSEKVLFVTNSRTVLTPGKEIVLLNDQFIPAWRSKIESCTTDGKEMLIGFSDPVPEWVHEKTPVEPQEWLPDSLHIVNSVYRSTGRFGVYLKASNTLIENCLFENNVAGIHVGGEWSWGYWLESTNSQNVEIRNCTFRDNRLDIRYGGEKMDVAIDINSWTVNTAGQMHNILIHDNSFEDESLCVSLQNCSDVWFWNNKIKNCGKDLLIDDKTAENIHRSAPKQ